jgi:hypothetical protein
MLESDGIAKPQIATRRSCVAVLTSITQARPKSQALQRPVICEIAYLSKFLEIGPIPPHLNPQKASN